MNKQDRVNKEIEILSVTFKDIEKDRKRFADNLIRNVAFMTVVLEELQDEINANGTTEHFINGKQDFIRESTSLKAYNTTIKNYQSAIKQLLDMLPDTDNKKQAEDELLKFLKTK